MAYNQFPLQDVVPGDPQPYHRQMRNSWFAVWRPALGTLAILCGWIIITVICVLPIQALDPEAAKKVGWEMLLATNLSLAALIPLSLGMAKFLHQQPSGLLSSLKPGLRWRPLAIFLIAAVVVEVAMLGVALLLPVDFATEVSGKADDATAIIVVVLLTSTFQAAGEEYFFRGYLLQAFGSIMRSPIVPILLTALIFTLFHGVWPWESLALFFDRFAFGVLAGWLVVRTGGLEAAIAVHAVNNIITFIFAAMTDSVTESLGITDAPWSLVLVDIAKFVLFAAIGLWIARKLDLQRTARVALPPLAKPV
ncbi:CPBP family intramembrane glutamic endopeptidase [Kribbella deserti]|uniref:Lysostaphin resistance A-like protein n=1 Tax=Kribbella deserti TaxID=1926257 RepID=A0ABV6QV30_9ACTN